MYLSLPPRDGWQAQAACLGAGPSAFYPEKGVQPEETAATRAICAGCPVSAECGAAGKREGHGMWGGRTFDERRGRKRAMA